jgi:hypothetical protein
MIWLLREYLISHSAVWEVAHFMGPVFHPHPNPLPSREKEPVVTFAPVELRNENVGDTPACLRYLVQAQNKSLHDRFYFFPEAFA